jgi:hypothetical protein
VTKTKTKTTISNRLGVKPGDIYSATFGYDEVRVAFYQVVRVTAAKAELLPIGATEVGGGVIPDSSRVREWDVLIGVNPEDTKRTKLCTVGVGYDGQPSIVLRAGQYWAHQWRGRPEYQSERQW